MPQSIQMPSIPKYVAIDSVYDVHPLSIKEEQSYASKLDVHDVPLNMADNSSFKDKPLLAAPLLPMDREQIFTELDELEKPENKERLDDLQVLLTLTPEKIEHAFSTVLQRVSEAAKVSGDDHALIEATRLQTDPEDQRDLMCAIPYLLATEQLNRIITTRMGTEGSDEKKNDTSDPVKSSEFVGFSDNSTMIFLLSMLRQVMAEINISERKIVGLFAKISSEMTEASAASTIREGKEILNSAIKGFATSMVIATGGAALQVRGLHKQNQAVKEHLDPANQHRADAHELQKNMHQTTASADGNRTHTGQNGETMTHADMPNETEHAQFQQRQQAQINEKHRDAELHGQKYEQKTNAARIQTSLAEQASRQSDNTANLASSSNKVNEKEAEADKMVESNAADIARGIVSDKNKNIENEQEIIKEMRRNMSDMRESTARTNLSIVRG